MPDRNRKPGDPLPPDFVKRVRQEAGLSQDAFAARLGLRGGKVTISGWETGRATCEGPVAELIVLMFGGKAEDTKIRQIRERMDTFWNRGATPLTSWRQVMMFPANDGMEIPEEVFGKLFPDAALPEEQVAHGFPMHCIPQAAQFYGRADDMWRGEIPLWGADARPAHYLWFFNNGSQFAYREYMWDLEPVNITNGNVSLPQLLVRAQHVCHFGRRVYEIVGLSEETRIVLAMELAGVRGKAVVPMVAPGRYNAMPPPFQPGLLLDDTLSGQIVTTVGQLHKDTVGQGIRLIMAAVKQVNPQLASGDVLEEQLKMQVQYDQGLPDLRMLTFMDEWLQTRG